MYERNRKEQTVPLGKFREDNWRYKGEVLAHKPPKKENRKPIMRGKELGEEKKREKSPKKFLPENKHGRINR